MYMLWLIQGDRYSVAIKPLCNWALKLEGKTLNNSADGEKILGAVHKPRGHFFSVHDTIN